MKKISLKKKQKKPPNNNNNRKEQILKVSHQATGGKVDKH